MSEEVVGHRDVMHAQKEYWPQRENNKEAVYVNFLLAFIICILEIDLFLRKRKIIDRKIER